MVTYVSQRAARQQGMSLRLRPSDAGGEAGWQVAERIALGPRLTLAGSPDMTALGEAIHAVLAYDDLSRDTAVRLADIAATLTRWGIKALRADDLMEASGRFFAFAHARWPGAVIRREAPVSASLGLQLVQGRIDLFVEAPAGLALVDHKSFPGRLDLWDAKAIGYAPQLDLYAQAVEAAIGRTCEELWIHMPVVGQLLRVARIPAGGADA